MTIEQMLKGFVKDRMDVPDRSIIIQEGGKSEWTFILARGRVKVKRKTKAGMVTLDTLGEGSVIGEVALLKDTNTKAAATVVADGPVRLVVLDREALRAEYDELSPHLKEVMQAVFRRLGDATQEVVTLAGRTQ